MCYTLPVPIVNTGRPLDSIEQYWVAKLERTCMPQYHLLSVLSLIPKPSFVEKRELACSGFSDPLIFCPLERGTERGERQREAKVFRTPSPRRPF